MVVSIMVLLVSMVVFTPYDRHAGRNVTAVTSARRIRS